ncbi:elongation factor 4 [Candidatus Parcubacteria bacterium 4484_255]|nr:MAG: elongation factor 4 [Candidatus Parcubacteria bacterium 4484_255]
MVHKRNIRNFCIISHIDHGKSTLADRFLEITNTVSKDKIEPQYLDRLPLEKERGITIKLQPVAMNYKCGEENYVLNLIDTPGHVDFSYEVSRSLAAVEGAILLVDATQGIQAQTLANFYLAKQQKLKIIPVINKIDLPYVDLYPIKKELSALTNVPFEDIISISAKTGKGVKELLDEVVRKVPAPQSTIGHSLSALIFDSYFDEYRGVVAFARIFNGSVRPNMKIEFIKTHTKSISFEVGIFRPELTKKDLLSAGEIGYIATGLKDINKCRVGDTISLYGQQSKALPGYQEPQPMVFAGIYPKDGERQEKLRRALEKLKLNDASLMFEPEDSSALGFGFRAGFLGLLHLDITIERLKREYNLDLAITAPSVSYKIFRGNRSEIVKSPSSFPEPSQIKKIEEPWVKIDIVCPQEYFGSLMGALKNLKRVNFISLEYIGVSQALRRVVMHYEAPLSLLLVDFYDKIKALSQGYASYSYEFLDYRVADVARLDILVAGDLVDQLATIVYRDQAYFYGRRMVKKLKELLPRQMFEIKIQAAIGGKILASEKISALRKNVTAKLYGGDVSRKNKLLKKQKKGKKRLARFGKVSIPSKAYLAAMAK